MGSKTQSITSRKKMGRREGEKMVERRAKELGMVGRPLIPETRESRSRPGTYEWEAGSRAGRRNEERQLGES